MFVGCGCHCNETQLESGEPVSLSYSSGSIRSYGSSVANPPGQYEGGLCYGCVDTVGAQIYEMEWIYNGQPGGDDDPRPCCQIYKSQTKFFLYRQPFSESPPIEIQGCTWVSRENAYMEYRTANVNQWQCAEAKPGNLYFTRRTPRVVMNIGRREAGFAPWSVNIVHGVLWPDIWDPNNPPLNPSGFVSVYYQLRKADDPTGFWPEPVPCLQTQTLTRRDLPSPNIDAGFGPIWGALPMPYPTSPWRGSPCKQVLFSGFDLGLPDTITIRPVQA